MGIQTQLSTEGERLRSEISARGYYEMQHDISSDEVEQLISAYADFTLAHPDPMPETMHAMLPTSNVDLEKRLDELDRSRDTQKEWHKYRTNIAGIGKPDGYTNRSFQEYALKSTRGSVIPPEDPKEFFHFTSRLHVAMARNHQEYGWGAIPPEVFYLESAFRPIHTKASKLILKVAGLIEETNPEIRNFFDVASLAGSPVRLLFYHPDSSMQLGAGHYDKSSLTIQIAESHEGLRVAPDSERDLEPVVRESDTVVVFAGRSFQQKLPADTIFQPGWHDIVKVNQLNHGRNVPSRAAEVCARWALIFFANGSDFVNPDKATTHSR